MSMWDNATPKEEKLIYIFNSSSPHTANDVTYDGEHDPPCYGFWDGDKYLGSIDEADADAALARLNSELN
jgi:hypothetical protein